MRMVDLIRKKRSGDLLSKKEIGYIVDGFAKGDIPDYQVSAFLMAVCFNGMEKREIADLTMAMAESGETIDLSAIAGIKVDKHSSGGVGDKISLIVAPLVAYAGIPVAKMSGRGLGHTGGTIDKLESIPGFKTELPKEQFIGNVNRYKLAIVGQTGDLAPADKKMYALRDVTATVDSIPLIASSIMSKKIAAGADCIVLDVKAGSGAFMKTPEEAERLACTMVEIGQSVGKKTVAVITDMSQPLGREVGNASEIREVIEVLRGQGPGDLVAIALALAAQMAVLGGAYRILEEAEQELSLILRSGRALETFRQFVEAQGGDPSIVDHPEKLPQAASRTEIKAERSGYISRIDAEAVGLAAMKLGAGRARKEDPIDYAAGISVVKKVGEKVEAGDVLYVLHSNRPEIGEAVSLLKSSCEYSADKPADPVYVYRVVE